MKNNVSETIKKQLKRFCDFIEEGTAIVMMIVWASGFYAAYSLIAAQTMDKSGIIVSAIISMVAFAISYTLHKSMLEKKNKNQKVS